MLPLLTMLRAADLTVPGVADLSDCRCLRWVGLLPSFVGRLDQLGRQRQRTVCREVAGGSATPRCVPPTLSTPATTRFGLPLTGEGMVGSKRQDAPGRKLHIAPVVNTQNAWLWHCCHTWPRPRHSAIPHGHRAQGGACTNHISL